MAALPRASRLLLQSGVVGSAASRRLRAASLLAEVGRAAEAISTFAEVAALAEQPGSRELAREVAGCQLAVAVNEHRWDDLERHLAEAARPGC